MRPYQPQHPQQSRPSAGATDPDQLERMRSRRAGGTYDAYLEGRTKTPPLFVPWDATEAFDELDQRHGTPSAYTSGCRCPWCRLAGKASRNARKVGIPLPPGWNARTDLAE